MFISLLFILFFISEFFNNSECGPKRRGEGASSSKRGPSTYQDEDSLLIEATTEHLRNMELNVGGSEPFHYSNDQTEQNKLVEIKNSDRALNKEWILAKLLGKNEEDGKFIVQVKYGPFTGKIFRRYLNEIYKVKNPYFLNNELVEIFIYNQWMEGIILNFEDGEYNVNIEKGPFNRFVFTQININGLRKLKLNIGEIVTISNRNKFTGENEFFKAKILEKINEDNYKLRIVDHCDIKGKIMNRTSFNIHKFKIEKFNLGDRVEVKIFNIEKKGAFWKRAKVIKIEENDEYTLLTKKGPTTQPFYFIRKI